jgi:hypothetical protein
MRLKFRAKLYRVTMVRWADLPAAAVKKLKLPPAQNRGWQAVLRFNGDIDRVTLLPGKRGKVKLAFKVELLRAAGVEAGDEIEFTLEADPASREPEVPEEMRKAFLARPKLREAWERESIALRRQLVRYVYQAKSPEVQAKRCWIFIDRLAETGSVRHPDYK